MPLVAHQPFAIPGAMPKTKGKKRITREDVLIPFLKALKIPIYHDPKMKGAVGLYYPKSEATKLKRASDLEVAAHEIAHLLDDRWWRTRKGHKGDQPWHRGNHPDYKVFSNELKSVSYDVKKVYEGFAEFVRLWMTQPDKAYSAAPEFAAWWEEYLTTAKHGEAVLKARKSMLEWFNQDAVDRLLSKVGKNRSLSEALDNFWDDSRQSIFDNLHAVKVAEEDLTGIYQPVGGVYEIARLTRAAYSMVDGALRYGPIVVQKDNSLKFEGKGLREILDPVAYDMDHWIAYAVARSADELRGQGRENLISREEIASGLALEKPEFKKAFDEYQAWNKAIVDFAVKKGLIAQSDREKWRRKEYLPFYRINTPGVTRAAKGVQGYTKVVHRLSGGTENLAPILDNMVNNATRMIVESLKNEARVKIVDMAMKAERGGGRYLTPQAKEIKAVSIESSQVIDKIYESLGLNPAEYRKLSEMGQGDPEIDRIVGAMSEGMDEYTKFWQFGQAPQGQNVIAVMRKGKPHYYQIGDPLLMRSIASLTPREMSGFVKVLSTARRIGQGTVTFTIDFMLANIWRDTLHGAVLSTHGFKPVISSARGMEIRIAAGVEQVFKHKKMAVPKWAAKEAEIYKDFLANGAGFSSYMVDDNALQEHLTDWYGKNGYGAKGVIHTGKQLFFALETMGDAFEMSTRIAEFERAVKQGENPRHAAFLAREISTDFAMRGDSEALSFFYDTVLFLKAAINGMDRVYRGLTKDENRAQVWAKTAYIANISMALALWNRGNDCYN